jgi:hypothetical protein
MRHQCLQLAFALSFLSALDHEFERFGYLNTLSSKSLDIPFLNCSILPERSFAFRITSGLLRPFYSFTFHRSTDFCWFGGSDPIRRYYIIPVYSHSLLIRFAHLAAIAGPFLRRRPRPTDIG